MLRTVNHSSSVKARKSIFTDCLINTESLISSCNTNSSNIPFIKVYRCYVKMLFVEIGFAHLYNKYVNNNYVLKTHILDTGDKQYLSSRDRRLTIIMADTSYCVPCPLTAFSYFILLKGVLPLYVHYI